MLRCFLRSIILVALVQSLVDGLSSPLPPPKKSSVHLRVVHFNDVYKMDNLAKFKGYLDHIKQKDRDTTQTVCTLGGDFFSPSLLSSIDEGRAMVACLNEFVDYACLGNHEADHGSTAFCNNVNNFRGTIVNSNFPIMPATQKEMPESVRLSLSSQDGTNQRQVTLLGLLDSSPNLHLPNAFCSGAVENAVPIAESLRQHMKENNNKDLLLPLTHQDLDMDVQLAQEFGCPYQMPLILGGHDHDPFDVPITDDNSDSTSRCRVLKAGMDAANAIIVDIAWESAESKSPTIQVEFVNITALGDTFTDNHLQRMIHQFQAPLRRLDRTVLKAIESRDMALSSVNVRKQQTTVGSLICTAVRKALRADVAMVNGGSIRGNTVYNNRPSDGRIGRFFTFADLVKELPYTTEICVIGLPGSVLVAAINYSRNCGGDQGGGFLQCCNKMKVVQEPCGKYKILQIRGEPFDLNRIYKVATLHHLLTGMDDVKPLVDYANQNRHKIPHFDATQPAKELVLEVYYREIWLTIGSFDDIDTDGTNEITHDKLGQALAHKFGIDPVDEFVNDTLRAFDTDNDGVVTREEYDACMHAIERNRFDLSPQECTGIRQVMDVVKYINARLHNKDKIQPKALQEVMQLEHRQAGEVILQQGDAGDCLYFCEKGRVQFIADGKEVGTCGKGSSFGELSLLYDSPRAATCVAASDCLLWKVDHTAFSHLLVQAVNQQNQEVTNVVQYLNMAINDPTERSYLQKVLEVEQKEAGQDILQQGDASDFLYFCERGQVRFTTDGMPVGSCGPGGAFGELALLYDSPRAATCVALSNCQLWKVDRSAFEQLLSRSSAFRRRDPVQVISGPVPSIKNCSIATMAVK